MNNMKIYIPHIHYTVLIRKRSEFTGSISSLFLCERTDKNTSTLFIEYPLPKYSESTLAHEITHILQNICQDRHMDFIRENEHMGYLMQYIMNQILGYKYV